jgi:hypothetical protein
MDVFLLVLAWMGINAAVVALAYAHNAKMSVPLMGAGEKAAIEAEEKYVLDALNALYQIGHGEHPIKWNWP